jgi:hypothetical protein
LNTPRWASERGFRVKKTRPIKTRDYGLEPTSRTMSHNHMSMGSAALPPLYDFPKMYWAVVGSAIGVAALVNLYNHVLCRQRLSAAKAGMRNPREANIVDHYLHRNHICLDPGGVRFLSPYTIEESHIQAPFCRPYKLSSSKRHYTRGALPIRARSYRSLHQRGCCVSMRSCDTWPASTHLSSFRQEQHHRIPYRRQLRAPQLVA